MSTAEALKAFAATQLGSLATQSGRILYSSAETLCPGPIYLLGLNPGGSPARSADTIASSLEALTDQTENAYLDERWKGRPNGEAPLQRRVRWLLEGLGASVRHVCASNLIFVRSVDAAGCGYPHTAALCWPVHERILQVVQPRLVLTIGNSGISPFQFLRDVYRPSTLTHCASGHGSWRCVGFSVPGRMKVVGLPHLSRYAIDRHPHVIDWIKAYSAS